MNILSSKSTVGERIREVRKSNHLSQPEFIEKIGISVNFLSELENNKKTMSIETLKRICTQYSVSSDYILFGKHGQTEEKELLQLVVERGNNCSLEQIDSIVSYFKDLKKIKKVMVDNQSEKSNE